VEFNDYGRTPVAVSYGALGPNDTFYAVLLSDAFPSSMPLAVGRSGGGDFPTVSGTQLHHWYHLAISHDGTFTKIFLDGDLKGSAQRTYNTTLPGTWHIGSYLDPAPNPLPVHLNGLVDNVRVYDRALTDQEVASLFSFGL
jgi:hypothetical protein